MWLRRAQKTALKKKKKSLIGKTYWDGILKGMKKKKFKSTRKCDECIL